MKDIAYLGRDPARTIIIDNSPECLESNPLNAVLVNDYDASNDSDISLTTLFLIINDLIHTTESVVDYLARCRHVRQVAIPSCFGVPLVQPFPLYMIALPQQPTQQNTGQFTPALVPTGLPLTSPTVYRGVPLSVRTTAETEDGWHAFDPWM
jgi:hypothetical protein